MEGRKEKDLRLIKVEYDSEQIDPETNGDGENKIETRGAGGVWRDSITIGAQLDFPTFQNGQTNFLRPRSGSQRENHTIASALRQPRAEPLPLLPAPLFRALCVFGEAGGGEKHCGILRLKLCIFQS